MAALVTGPGGALASDVNNWVWMPWGSDKITKAGAPEGGRCYLPVGEPSRG